jgi:hypothetical protein
MDEHFLQKHDLPDPRHMMAQARLGELVGLLTARLMRSRADKSSPLFAGYEEFLVDFSPVKSGVHRRKLRHR